MFEVEVEVSGIQKTRRVLGREFLPVGRCCFVEEELGEGADCDFVQWDTSVFE